MNYSNQDSRMKKQLAQADLDKAASAIIRAGSSEVVIDRKAPRFECRECKVTPEHGKKLKREKMRELRLEIKDLQERLDKMRKSPPPKTEWRYVELRKGSKAWKKHGVPAFFPLIVSKEVSDELLKGKNP